MTQLGKISTPRGVVSAQHPRGASFLIRRWDSYSSTNGQAAQPIHVLKSTTQAGTPAAPSSPHQEPVAGAAAAITLGPSYRSATAIFGEISPSSNLHKREAET